jgi:hypothetical protein
MVILIVLLGIYPKKMKTHVCIKSAMDVSIEALLVSAKT